jgi:hypothetical protein
MMIRGEIVFQPLEFGSKPGARAAARLCLALYVKRDKVPRAQIIGIPAISDSDWASRRYCVSKSARLLEVPRRSVAENKLMQEDASLLRSAGNIGKMLLRSIMAMDRSSARHHFSCQKHDVGTLWNGNDQWWVEFTD